MYTNFFSFFFFTITYTAPCRFRILFLIFFQTDATKCFKIEEIYVKELFGSEMKIDVTATLNNPGLSAWLHIGEVTSDVVEIDMALGQPSYGTERQMGVLKEKHVYV